MVLVVSALVAGAPVGTPIKTIMGPFPLWPVRTFSSSSILPVLLLIVLLWK
jgi:hypothetical protein